MRRLPFSGIRAASALCMLCTLAFSACLTISDPPEGLSVFTIIGGNNQTIAVSAVAAPLVVQTLDHTASPMGGVTVNWAITTGNGTLSAPSTVTDDTGNTAITFTASATPGVVQVRATAEDLRLTFNLNVIASSAVRE